ncbi:hypothetical protein A2837_01170 [Candidatus Kaiserbacteria bacterium RIFCSPHIGHO2_01_FULL_46_22]|uniref:Uncharacterized protein n=1 Tax=Candidatus Kaiserbacteria bacterium RIFCSPHIGHO2_01_FULL_46_22 TaxID=1798475 RepID=A0A1F6BYA6_9BACT|nr:MAG: hypothetical protein A2837_01170 [Candidatus Kaiserbacteria bacterium RIFCSPHIGHO2_01_FULL_46_22]
MNKVVQNTTGKFESEHVASEYKYPSEYKPKPLAEQMRILRKEFTGIEHVTGNLDANYSAPGADGAFLIPRFETFSPSYNEALKMLLDKLEKRYDGNFYNYQKYSFGKGELRQSVRSENAWRRLGRKQKSNVILLPAQTGIKYRGHSTRLSREKFAHNEFGLGAFAGGIILLTHPERFPEFVEDNNDLWIDFAGDEYAPDADGVFSCAPVFRFRKKQLEFDFRRTNIAAVSYGSASAFTQ